MNIEKIIPKLATKEDLKEMLSKHVTTDDLVPIRVDVQANKIFTQEMKKDIQKLETEVALGFADIREKLQYFFTGLSGRIDDMVMNRATIMEVKRIERRIEELERINGIPVVQK